MSGDNFDMVAAQGAWDAQGSFEQAREACRQ